LSKRSHITLMIHARQAHNRRRIARMIRRMFHVFTVGASMLGWHSVPAGFGGARPMSCPCEVCPQACTSMECGFMLSIF
jgi:hypothetical protein